ncbi:hypothetical protein [Nocardia terpenica]|uniref:Uncharacterized protein n=1 Tax=Nocardia terpenica TaxID=455432 RepID=A0A164H3C4_9NOCA|nr:hypothetical protein [Nocardia terpenica]KZM68166.1 hypothetical protein AWN90_09505 [Nocardia terpenica]NQE88974.1 hypothetical protein [Nocardia terpenica]
MCDTSHRTEADGLCAEWKILARRRIGIVAVRNTFDGGLVVRFPSYPDLALARELCPEWETLWNAVRHDYWTHALQA